MAGEELPERAAMSLINANVAQTLREHFAELPEAHFELLLEIANPNEPVEVEEPTDAQPLPG